MTQDNQDNIRQVLDSGSSKNTEPADEQQTTGISGNSGEIGKKLTGRVKSKKNVPALLHHCKEEFNNISDEAEDLVRHPRRFTPLGAGFAGSLVGDSLGEAVGAILGSALGPEGTVIGAEVGSFAGQVFGDREGEGIGKKLLHDTGTEASLKKDVQKEGTAEVSGNMGKKLGSMIGYTLLDDAGTEIGEAVGETLGELSGEIGYKFVGKKHIKKKGAPTSDSIPQKE